MIPTQVQQPAGSPYLGRVSRDMSLWAVDVLHRARAEGWDTNPVLRFEDRTFDSTQLRAWVCWHPPDFQNAVWHSGVTLLSYSDKAEGVDVSHYQGNVDWDKVAAAGKSFAFVKVSEGVGPPDDRGEANMKGFDEAGLLVGAYHFFRPQQDPAKQAQAFLAAAGNVTLRYVVDVEVYDGKKPEELRAALVTFLREIPCRAMIYTTKAFIASGAIPSQDEIPFGFDLWIAQWGGSAPDAPFWQYSQMGEVPGIAGHVDLNRFNGTVDELKAWVTGAVQV